MPGDNLLRFRLQSSFHSRIDDLRRSDASFIRQISLILLFALLTVAGAKISVSVGEIPFTLQTVAVYAAGLFLGWRNGAFSQLLYLALGLFFPVLADPEGSGWTYMTGRVSSGYLLAFPLVAAVAGKLSQRWNSPVGAFLSLEAASLTLFIPGVAWLHKAAGFNSIGQAIRVGWLAFLPVDLLKILLVTGVFSVLRYLWADTPGMPVRTAKEGDR